MKISLYDTKEYDIEYFEKANKEHDFFLRYLYDKFVPENIDLAVGSDAVCVFANSPVNADALDALEAAGIKLLLLRSAGYNHVDLEAAQARGIAVANVPEYSPSAVAEYSMAMMLSLSRKIHKAYWRTKEHNFSLHNLMGFNMEGKVVGVVGLGRIGSRMAEMLGGFRCEILGYDPYPNHDFAKENRISLVTLDELLCRSDVITLHCPLMPGTRHIINHDSIANMKDGVMIINTSRGGLIDTQALIQALRSGKIAGAALDVYEEEEKFFYEDWTDSIVSDDTLLQVLALPNVLVTSHQAYFTRESMRAIAETTLFNAAEYGAGKPLTHAVYAKK